VLGDKPPKKHKRGHGDSDEQSRTRHFLFVFEFHARLLTPHANAIGFGIESGLLRASPKPFFSETVRARH